MNLLVRFLKIKHTKYAMAIAYSILLVLPGCGIPQLRNPWVSRELPSSFNVGNSTENSSQIGIEEFFNDPILTGLIHQGLTGNQELKILAEDIQIADNEILKRRGAYLPFLTLGAGASLNKFSDYTLHGADNIENSYPGGSHFPRPLPNFLTAANLSWQIDIWRQLRNDRDAAARRFLGTTEGRNYVVTRLVAEIAENYYGLLALDKRLETLDITITLQEQSLEIAKAQKEGVRGTELGVQRFRAEVRKNQSQKLIVRQEIVEVENRINFLAGRFPEPVQRRSSEGFYDLNLHALGLGVPCDLLLNRPDIRKAERELEAAGLDVKVARANFYPKLVISSAVGYEAFNARYLFQSPDSLIYSVAGDLVAPLINKRAIQADYKSANARQLQTLYDYQRTVLEAFTEVVNRMSKVENYTKSIEIKRQQLESLEASVEIATKLFQNARTEYIDVLFAQRDLNEARQVLIDTKREQLGAIVNTYQALGGGLVPFEYPEVDFAQAESPMPTPVIPIDMSPTAIPPAPEQTQQVEAAQQTEESKD